MSFLDVTAAILVELTYLAPRAEMPFWITSRRRATILWANANIFFHIVRHAAHVKAGGLCETEDCDDEIGLHENRRSERLALH